jgi:hypothetical protein
MSALKRNSVVFGVASFATAVTFSMPASAVVVPLVPAADYGAATDVNTTKVDGGPGSSSTFFSSATDFGQGSITFLPLPTMTATAQESGTNTVGVGLVMHYFFEFASSAPEVLPSQPIFLTSGSVSVAGSLSSSGSGGVSATVNMFSGGGPLSYSLGSACAGSGCSGSVSFSQMTQPSIAAMSGLVQTNAIYEITMNAGATAGQGDNITAFLDPQITYDLSADAGVTLLLSEGVGNTPPTSTTPLPAALPLFATGLGAFGLLARRRKRKASAAA